MRCDGAVVAHACGFCIDTSASNLLFLLVLCLTLEDAATRLPSITLTAHAAYCRRRPF
jgi:hypothetical protein